MNLDEICLKKEQRLKTQSANWWSTQLHNLQRMCRTAEKDWKKLTSKQNQDQENILELLLLDVRT